MRTVTDRERRARLARRHGLAPEHRYADVGTATQAMTVWHATEAATVHLALHARVDGLRIDDVEHALYEDRSLVKHLAMRRTLFAFPRDLLPAAMGSASARVAAQEGKNLHKWLTAGGVVEEQDAWLRDAYAATLAALADGVPRTSTQLRDLVPALDLRFRMGSPGKKWGGEFPIGRWVIGTLAAQGHLMRANNLGHWRLNKPAWTVTESWLGDTPVPLTAAEGYAELVRRWLWTFGPGTETDLVWWLGSTKSAVRAALATIGAVQVGLEGGGTGWVLPDDPIATDPEPETEPWAALVPTLDPTVMGWKERGFYLDGEDVAYLFDSNGNAGNTAWWDGRIVGAWAQDQEGQVHPIVRHDIGEDGTRALKAEAERLTQWLDGVVIVNVYKSRQMKEAKLP
ncbi:winged helix DNA-binding protein [Nocardioides albertanoniae]|uniref:Winged helix DNA-binding protein n=1 Tax=Nocardioides albertanoniae TaxID=1175486 RepID=A0A543AAT6_9ACTN|nr:winged helix DNA-binding domain-containing protein [Nocardioides albertanoniae]TQL69566.1 winged helix DNA-binding protein [Nocardioides albertanoniae]